MKKTLLILGALFINAAIFAASAMVEEQYLTNARNAFELGQYKYAAELYDTVAKMNMTDYRAYAGKGNCQAMLGDSNEAQRLYNKALSLNPAFKPENLDRFREADRKRGKNADEIKKRYWEMFGKKDAPVDVSHVPVETGKVEVTPLPEGARPAAKVRDDRNWNIRGGRGKLEALGGIRYIYPDMSTALDGAGQGIDAGYLFREQRHVFNLEPMFGKSNTGIRPVSGQEIRNDYMIISGLESTGESNWPNNFFLNRITPFYQNSNKLITDPTALNPDNRVTNSGNLYGGKYTAGVKPIPVFGFSGSISYKIVPYHESTVTGGLPLNKDITATELAWEAGAGFFFPYIITKYDQLDFVFSYGSYSPKQDFMDVSYGDWFKLPYSLLHNYTLKVTNKETLDLLGDPTIPPGVQTFVNGLLSSLGISTDVVTRETSDVLEVDGKTAKANLHYMDGNCQHEFFVYAEAPHSIQYKMKTTEEYRVQGYPDAISPVSSDSIDMGNLRMFILRSGIRNNFKYVTTGFKYEFGYSEGYYNTTLTAKFTDDGTPSFGKEIGHTFKLTGGLNITPVELVSLPLEYEYEEQVLDKDIRVGPGITARLISNTYRGGLEIKPIPSTSIRFGLSHEFIRVENSFDKFSSGTPNNPYFNVLGYHVGGGFDLPFFELNVGYVYKKAYLVPEKINTTDTVNDTMLFFGDISLYI